MQPTQIFWVGVFATITGKGFDHPKDPIFRRKRKEKKEEKRVLSNHSPDLNHKVFM